MSTEVIHAILFLSLIGWILIYFIWRVIDFKKELRRRDRERLEFLESLQHGVVFVERLQAERNNPFLPIRQQKTVTVLETRINKYGETWVKYREDGDNDILWYCPAQNFEKMYVKK